MKRFLLSVLFFCSVSADQEITGLWKSKDGNSDKPRSLVVIYKYEDKYYGRMIATYDEEGKIGDSILEKKDKATGVVGNPPYCGMDFVYNIQEIRGNKYTGKIIDPQKGKIYSAKLWRSGNDLIMRGELFIFGKNIRWPAASVKDLPNGFKMREIEKFVPVIPQVMQ